MSKEITLKIILEDPAPGIDFGLQRGAGIPYETVQRQRSTDKNLFFECQVTLKNNKSGSPDFFGHFAQGPSAGRFIYIDIGTAAGQINTAWSRRLKIPLDGALLSELKKLDSKETIIAETRLPAMGKDGGPNCGTVKPFPGWKIMNPKMDI